MGAIAAPFFFENNTRLALLQNESRVFLISNQYCIPSVHVLIKSGSFNDDQNFYGCAHLMEHILTSDIRRCPEGQSFSRFIRSHSGCESCITEHLFTNFAFEINQESFEPALKLFVQILKSIFDCPISFSDIFVHPCISKESIETEVELIHSESLLRANHAGSRLSQIISLYTPKTSPFHRFDCGNRDTLLPSQVTLASRVDALIDFFHRHYCGSNLIICLIGNGMSTLL